MGESPKKQPPIGGSSLGDSPVGGDLVPGFLDRFDHLRCYPPRELPPRELPPRELPPRELST